MLMQQQIAIAKNRKNGKQEQTFQFSVEAEKNELSEYHTQWL